MGAGKLRLLNSVAATSHVRYPRCDRAVPPHERADFGREPVRYFVCEPIGLINHQV